MSRSSRGHQPDLRVRGAEKSPVHEWQVLPPPRAAGLQPSPFVQLAGQPQLTDRQTDRLRNGSVTHSLIGNTCFFFPLLCKCTMGGVLPYRDVDSKNPSKNVSL